MTNTSRIAILFTALVGIPGTAAAGVGFFSMADEYGISGKGDTWFELRGDHYLDTFEDESPAAFRLRFDVHHGVTENWEITFRHTFFQDTGGGTIDDPGAPFHLGSVGIMNRYKFPKTLAPFDMQFDSVITKNFGESIWTISPLWVFSKRMGRTVIAVNPTMDVTFGNDMEGAQVVPGWAGGIGFNPRPNLGIAAEMWGGFDTDDAEGTMSNAAGPSFTWMPSKGILLRSTAGFGLTEMSNAFTFNTAVFMKM